MEAASPARLYATVVGALLVVLGILGFFYTATFGGSGSAEEAFGLLWVNGWLNVLYIAIGALGLLLADTVPRPCSLAAGVLFTVLAIWGWTIDDGDSILGFLPAGGANEELHLALGLLGLAAAAGTPKPRRSPGQTARKKRAARRKPRRSKPRAKAAGKRP